MCTVIFRPHTYTRTESLWDGFVRSLSLADFSVLVDIYPARETPIPGITSQRLALAIGERSRYLPMDAVVDYVISQTDGAIILMGAGDVEKIKNSFLESDKFKEI